MKDFLTPVDIDPRKRLNKVRELFKVLATAPTQGHFSDTDQPWQPYTGTRLILDPYIPDVKSYLVPAAPEPKVKPSSLILNLVSRLK